MGKLIIYLVGLLGAMLVPDYQMMVRFESPIEVDSSLVAYTIADPEARRALIVVDTLAFPPDSNLAIALVVHELSHVAHWELGMLAERQNGEYAAMLQEQLANRYARFFFQFAQWTDEVRSK